jgi:hypothetical protein
VLTLAIFHTPQSLAKVAQKIDEGMDVPKRLTGVLGISYPSQPSHVKLEYEEKISNRSTVL